MLIRFRGDLHFRHGLEYYGSETKGGDGRILDHVFVEGTLVIYHEHTTCISESG